MGRENYVSLYTDSRTNEIFNSFVQLKGVTKATALGDMMRLYMLATDPNLYNRLLSESLRLDRVRDEILMKDDSSPFNDFLFMKIMPFPDRVGEELTEKAVVEAYRRKIEECGKTWFSTSVLSTGMSKGKVKFYNDAIENGREVRILFALGNEICFSGRIKKIVSDRNESKCPGDSELIPIEFGPDEMGKIWLLLDEIIETNDYRADQMFFSTGRSVYEVISESQCTFGYVKRI